jgi:signal peptidase
MSNTDSTGGRPPSSTARGLLDWFRIVVGTLARSVVVTLLGLALWAAAPAAIGWTPTTVMTGSMEPRLSPGDVVVSRPVPAEQVRAGRVLLADDPDQAGHLRMHRYVQNGPDGTIITKGDANPRMDSTPIDRSAVHGVGYLRIPYVASPVLWLRSGEWARIVLAAAGLVGVLALCAVDRSLRRSGPAVTDGPDDGTDGPDDGTAGPGASRHRGGREARHRAATDLPAGAPHRAVARLLRRSHPVVAASVLVAVTAAGTALPLPAAAAPWTGSTNNPTTQLAAVSGNAVTGLTCSAATGSAQLTWTFPAGADPQSFELVANGTTVIRTVAGNVRTAPASGALLSLGPSTIRIRAVYAPQSGWSALGTPSARVTAVTSLLTNCG